MTSQWIQYVKAFQKANPQLTYKEAMSAARPSYKSVNGGKFSVGNAMKKVNKASKLVNKNIEKYGQFVPEEYQQQLRQAQNIAGQAQQLSGGKFKVGNALKKAQKISGKVIKNVDKYGLPMLEMAGVAVAPELLAAYEGAKMINTATGGSFKTHGGSFNTHGGGLGEYTILNDNGVLSFHPSFTPAKPKTYSQKLRTN